MIDSRDEGYLINDIIPLLYVLVLPVIAQYNLYVGHDEQVARRKQIQLCPIIPGSLKLVALACPSHL